MPWKAPRLALLTFLVVGCQIHGPSLVHAEDAALVRRELQERFRAVAQRLRPSLVRIETVGGTQPADGARPAPVLPDDDGGEEQFQPFPPRPRSPFQDTLGSDFVVAEGPTTGMVYSADGHIVTSSFNFVREPALITVTLHDGRRLAADFVARDQVRKIALLKVEAADLSVPQWVRREEIQVGQRAIALGLGYGGNGPSITVGIVSALYRMHGNALQTDAKLNPANYGGPVCDLEGRVLGISVPMAQRPGELAGIEFYDSGVGFAVPKERMDQIVSVLKTGLSFYRGWLGISLDPRVTDAVVIGNIADPSPMKDAGVVIGDRIVRANGEEVRHFGHLVHELYMIPAGETVHLELEREGALFEAHVMLARSVDLGPLPDLAEPFDPAEPLPELDGTDEEDLP